MYPDISGNTPTYIRVLGGQFNPLTVAGIIQTPRKVHNIPKDDDKRQD